MLRAAIRLTEAKVQVVRELAEVEIASARHPRRRVVVLLRDDGHFTFAEQYHYTTVYEGEIVAEGWATLPANGIYATAERAEAEGRAAMSSWHRQSG
jgi:hypothetical protein